MIKDLENEVECNNSISSLKECSYDKTNDEYLIDLNKPSLNFDCLSRIVTSKFRMNIMRSADAFVYINGEPCFIEFKNTANPKKIDLLKKFYESLIIFCQLTNAHYKYFVEHVVLYVIYNPEKNVNSSDSTTNETSTSKDGLHKHSELKAKEKIVKFDLNELQGRICKNIYTLTASEFINKMNSLVLINGKKFSYN